MNALTLNLLLATMWMLLGAELTLARLFTGFLVGLAAIVFAQSVAGRSAYGRSAAALVRLAASFLAQLVRANVTLARDVLRRTPRFHPAILAIDVGDLPPAQVVHLGCLISLTPGTLTLDTAEDGRTLFVHTLYAQDEEGARRRIARHADLIRRVAGGGGRVGGGGT